MMKPTLYIISFFLVIAFLSSCEEQKGEEKTSTSTASLKNTFKDDFLIGTALGTIHINKEDVAAQQLIETEFSSITPENDMKSMHIHPAQDTFYFEKADQFVAIGEQNEMYIIGHTLVWHSQLSKWWEAITDSTEMSQTIENHINTIVGRYKGRIQAWDVVNEALNEDGTLRESIFLKTIGEDYLYQAFELAAKADPEAKLYYNDYNLCQTKKRAGAIELIKNLQAKGAKIDGVGIQGHWSLNGPSIEEIEKSILEYAALGIQLAFTEVDVTVLPSPWEVEIADVDARYENNEFMNPYPETLPDSVQTQLANRYEEIFQLFLKHQDKIDRVTFWGVHDGHSWKNGWPIKGRTDYPLLFDKNYQPKAAYHRIMNLKESEG